MGRRWLLAAAVLSGCASHASPRDDEAAPGDGAWSDACHAEPVSLAELHSGLVRPGRLLEVRGLVASSRKFLLSQASSGACLWGAFAAGDGLVGAGSGLLLVSAGQPHAEGERCAAGTDGLPDDLELGDAVAAQGVLDPYAPNACPDLAPALQLRLDPRCPLERGERRPSPEPLPIDDELAERLAAGGDPGLLRDFGAALVELDDVSALRDPRDGDAVFEYGVIRLATTALEVHSRLYYYDLRGGGPGAAGKAPRFSYPRKFQRVAGLIFLDYCRWVLAPRDPCADISEPSEGCAR